MVSASVINVHVPNKMSLNSLPTSTNDEAVGQLFPQHHNINRAKLQ